MNFPGKFSDFPCPNGSTQKNKKHSAFWTMQPTSGSTLALGGYPSEWGNCPVGYDTFFELTRRWFHENPLKTQAFFSGTNGVGESQLP